MDPYAMERWLLERHAASIREAERRHALLGGLDRPRLGLWVAGRLHQIADRLEGRSLTEPGLPGGTQILSNGPF